MRVRLNITLLRDLVARSNLSQNHWALRMGVSRGHWSDILNGKHPYPSPKTRQRMVEVFGVSANELFLADAGATDVDFRAALYDRYAIDRELGQGAMGSVYLAREVARGRTVAIKVLAPEALGDVGVAGFLREISVLSRLQHPNILPLFDAGDVAGSPFYVMPWIRQGSLRDRLRAETRLSLSAVTTIVRGVSAALHYAHGEHVLHCDVKPENILIHDDHPYVMDFGISRILHAEVSELRTHRGLDVSAGTPAYVSPEQASGEKDLDGRADVYSLACVVYELLAGRPPFEGTTTDAVVARRFVSAPPPLREYAPDVPPAVAATIARAMELDRNRRHATPVDFASDLAQAATGARAFVSRASVAVTRAVASTRRALGKQPANRLGGSLVQLVQDTRFAVRGLRRNWRFALAFIVPLALGIGAGATFFSIIDHILYRPPPHVVKPDELLRIATTDERFPDPFAAGNISVAWIDYEALLRNNTTLASVAGFQQWRASLGRGADARVIPTTLATWTYFDVLGVHPQVGRFYTADEDARTSNAVPCVAGDRFWRTELGGTRDALGRRLTVGNLECTIVGVAPRGFNGTGFTPNDLWIPLRAGAEASQGDDALWHTDGSHWMRLLARARPGVSIATINQDATRAYRTMTVRRRDPKLTGGLAADKLMGGSLNATSPRIRIARWLVSGAAALVLLVAANVVNLLVARNLSRVRETAIRLALGGSRARLFRHYLLECLALSALAGAGALLVVKWVGPIARRALYPGTLWADGPVTSRIVLIAMGISLVAGGIIAAITALYASRLDPATLLSAGGGSRSTGSRRTNRVRLTLVGVQAAFSVALLLASAGFVRSFRTAASTAIGFDISGMIYADVPQLPLIDTTRAGHIAFFDELHARLKTVPGVTSVSLGYMNPWFTNRNEAMRIPGRDSLPLAPNFGEPAFDAVSPDYLTTMRMTMSHGRWIVDSDAVGAPPVMVVSETLAALYWPGERNVIGKCIQVGDSPACRTIVGVVKDIRFTGRLDDPLVPSYYLPAAQSEEFGALRRLFIRVDRPVESMIPVIRRIVQSARAGLPAADVHAMQDQLDPLLAPWRLGAMAFTALGIVAAIIATLGLFSVMAYLVAERGREFAIRSALGARAGQILTPLLRQGVIIVGVGSLVGVFVAWRAGKWIQPLLFQVKLLEPPVVYTVVALLLVAACAAALGPARRAAVADPIDSLRAD